MGNSEGVRHDPNRAKNRLSLRGTVVLTAQMLLCNKVTSYRKKYSPVPKLPSQFLTS